ncbi:DUF3567 domain-containing protein [Paucibacter sp. PLA-PC-4]|uniref:BTH_I0359 family protein n=1 Tax=Paucibacter sp. PLA-PC-4 TaxID=2993655 RepID=UPI00224960A8|nr:DUF3567 domain-containing protein [Paucibacter sp. PLA-PC-4]MCX2860342.1 DUF3567 domain-containing protein [Paucibacter sp. PLA-PC-4]
MHMLYNSPSFIVVQFDVPVAAGLRANDEIEPEFQLSRGGFEIVDKFARKEIFIEGALAEQFQQGVETLMGQDPSEEDLDDFIETYASLGNQPVVMH